jgi:hypothetical protein
MDNERRADLGGEAIMTAAVRTNVAAVEPAETSVIDVLAYVAHFCDRLGIDPRETFSSAIQSYEGDFEDGPRAEHTLDREAHLVEQGIPQPTVTMLCIRHPDHENEYEDEGGNVRVIDVDLGRSFDGKPDTLEQWKDWSKSVLSEVGDLPTWSSVRRRVERLVIELQPDD